MPLPDERPRQSVANLIGRFEQQGKRQASATVSLVPRSSSVSSQIAGDAMKEEVKEKREWPPRTAASADVKSVAPTLSSSPSGTSNSPVVSPQPIPDLTPLVDDPTTPTPASPEPVKSPPSKGKVLAVGKLSSATGTRRSAATAAKLRSPVASSSYTRPSTSSPPKVSLQSSVSQPLRPQHTGQSIASNPSTIRQTRPVPKTAPSTPSRPKSSAAQNQPVSRPKTPSSGLFAPTAASLARSRNAPPPPPPPVKKVTLSSDAAERLSKPTAASLSKARPPIPSDLSPGKVTKSTSTNAHGLTPRPSSKLKVRRISIKPKAANAKEETKPSLVSASPEPSRDSDHIVADHVENGDESGIVAYSNPGSPEDTHGQSGVGSDVAHDLAADEHAHSGPGILPEQQQGEHFVEEAHSTYEHEQVHLEGHEDSIPEPTESKTSEVLSNGDTHKVEHTTSGNDIEDMVNLLEGASISKSRPQSIVSIPDENTDEY